MTLANLVTLARLVLIPFVVLSFLAGPSWLFFLLLALVLVGDVVDGTLARLQQQITDLGKALDPIADKMLFASLFAALAFTGQIPWWTVVLLWVQQAALLVGGFWLYKGSRVIVGARLSGKVAATVLALGLLVLLVKAKFPLEMPYGTELVYLGVFLSYVSGLDYLWNAWRVIRRPS